MMRKRGVWVLLLCGLLAAPAWAGGVAWTRLGLDAAREKARAEGKQLLIKWDAQWCPPCKKLDQEVLSQKAGAELTQGLVALKLDFDAERNRAAIGSQVVLGLPTVVVYAPDGTEVGRVEGYETAEAWLGDIRALLAGASTLSAAERALAASPQDPVRWLRLGHALLVRGERARGEAELERAIWAQHVEASPEALFVLGRYYQRVLRDPGTARHLWRELALRYPASSWASGAWWWYAKAERELGAPQLGAAVLRARAEAHPDDVDAVAEWAEILLLAGLAEGRAEAAAAVRRAALGASDERKQELGELAAKLSAPGP